MIAEGCGERVTIICFHLRGVSQDGDDQADDEETYNDTDTIVISRNLYNGSTLWNDVYPCCWTAYHESCGR